ncbi:LysR family transcriptional regulator [Edaphobacillus lindanitolerans]|uniref:DNA-binding transcriptional regulator, LysR family n=1 Tax=Edaphobacillus lindanitolerans TaxID=550447 RepID=A0A1U7PN61_9BACI|nr:LysR family transcriptional regulator [Edaphobacillus lindanitolerans]SIT73392.1 DNA-binding transcriptional regulator, LysR family [Edaphobacillus lindanitolerans]
MDLEKVRYFVRVVEEGSVSKAAVSLNMTQPPLSISIRKLEEELGVPLFFRQGNRLILNETGQYFYKRSKELLFSADALQVEMKERIMGKRGEVTVGCSTIANLTIIPEVVKRLRDRDYRITVRVMEGNTAYILDQLRQHRMDIGLIGNTFDRADLNLTALLTGPVYAALPPGHPLSGRDQVNLHELQHDDFLMPYTSIGLGIADYIMEECSEQEFEPSIIYWGAETFPMLEMVKKGLGVAFVPALLLHIHGVDLPPLARIDSPSVSSKLNLVTLKNGARQEAAKRFLEVTEEVIAELKQSTTSAIR